MRRIDTNAGTICLRGPPLESILTFWASLSLTEMPAHFNWAMVEPTPVDTQ